MYVAVCGFCERRKGSSHVELAKQNLLPSLGKLSPLEWFISAQGCLLSPHWLLKVSCLPGHLYCPAGLDLGRNLPRRLYL